MSNLLIRYLIFLYVSLWSTNVFSELPLEAGSVHRDTSSFSHAQKLKVWDLEDVASVKGMQTIKSIIAYVSPENEQYEFVLERELLVAGIDVESKEVVGPWPLTRWPHETQDSDVSDIYNMEGAQEGDVWHLYAHERLIRPNSLGCLANTPLRYGDIEGNGLNSLALYIGKNDQQLDWVLFSPSAGKTEFSARLALQDFKNAPEQASVQYMSDALGHLGAMPGRRAYAKVYIDDFDGDEQQDILVWRKRFESLPSSDEREGFSLVKEVYRHYKKVEDEYQPQETDEDTIKGWLAANELTWQKGYPNKSECEGEEGELIPEMHDPLLNDLDVLQ